MASLSGDGDLVADYEITITGIERTRYEMTLLTNAIKSLRATKYSSDSTVIRSANLGSTDIFTSAVADLEGRVQTKASQAMLHGMNLGKQLQIGALRSAETKKGRSGHPKGRNGAGRDVTGRMIKEIIRNVEVSKTRSQTLIVGYHGWKQDRESYISYQEQGTHGRGGDREANSGVNRRKNTRKKYAPGQRRATGRGVPAANSLGQAIVPVREFLKTEIGRIG